jgi:type III secretory pathway component EscS
MSSRNYSPFAPRSYNPRSRKSSPLSSFSFLTSDKTKNFRISLLVIAVVLLGLALFFSYTMYLYRKHSQEQIRAVYPNLATTIEWTGSTSGQVFLAFLWIIFVLTIAPVGVGEWFRSHQKRIL